jgi:hypothetical protein
MKYLPNRPIFSLHVGFLEVWRWLSSSRSWGLSERNSKSHSNAKNTERHSLSYSIEQPWLLTEKESEGLSSSSDYAINMQRRSQSIAWRIRLGINWWLGIGPLRGGCWTFMSRCQHFHKIHTIPTQSLLVHSTGSSKSSQLEAPSNNWVGWAQYNVFYTKWNTTNHSLIQQTYYL